MKHWDILGVAGSGLIVLAFALIQSGKVKAHSMVYPLLNLTGASLVLVSLFYNFNLAAFLLEIFWILISVFGLIKYLKGSEI